MGSWPDACLGLVYLIHHIFIADDIPYLSYTFSEQRSVVFLCRGYIPQSQHCSSSARAPILRGGLSRGHHERVGTT